MGWTDTHADPLLPEPACWEARSLHGRSWGLIVPLPSRTERVKFKRHSTV
jgi:hypothetical protein